MDSGWKRFGMAGGIFWIGRTGIALRWCWVFDSYSSEIATYHRFYPFVFVRSHA